MTFTQREQFHDLTREILIWMLLAALRPSSQMSIAGSLATSTSICSQLPVASRRNNSFCRT